jgi:hypothetical protein
MIGDMASINVLFFGGWSLFKILLFCSSFYSRVTVIVLAPAGHFA